jgi:hypothetical protein
MGYAEIFANGSKITIVSQSNFNVKVGEIEAECQRFLSLF